MGSLTSLLALVNSHIHPHARSAKKMETPEEARNHLELELESFNFTSVENMTHEERDFHYFRLHDFDKNDLLDGLEVLKAMSHSHAKIMKEEADIDSSFDEMVGMIDKVLERDDANKDGFLSYSEFVAGRRREESDYDNAV